MEGHCGIGKGVKLEEKIRHVLRRGRKGRLGVYIDAFESLG